MPLGGSTDDIWCQVELECQEVVGMLCFNAIRLQVLLGKILEVESHDKVGTSPDRRSQNVSVVWVWQPDSFDECLVAGHKAIPDMGVHQVASPLKLLRLQVRTVFENIPCPLVVDSIGPFGAIKVRDSDMHQQVAKRSRVEDAGVIKNGEMAHFNSPCRDPGPGLPIRPASSNGCDPLPPCSSSNP